MTNKEIEEFVSMGKVDKIFPFIIDGKAFSEEHIAASGNDENFSVFDVINYIILIFFCQFKKSVNIIKIIVILSAIRCFTMNFIILHIILPPQALPLPRKPHSHGNKKPCGRRKKKTKLFQKRKKGINAGKIKKKTPPKNFSGKGLVFEDYESFAVEHFEFRF